jgi:RNA polymerase sigma factor (TIGR02999 family)
MSDFGEKSLGDENRPPAAVNDATRDIFPRVYEELRGLARRQMRHEKAGSSIQATALVHEVYLRLSNDPQSNWENPRYFFGAAAEAMRRILVERARYHRRFKRGGGRQRVEIDTTEFFSNERLDPDALISLHDLLEEFRTFDPDLCEVVMLRFFAGMTIEDVAAAIGRSPRSVKNDWSVARAWLLRRMEGWKTSEE